MSGTQFLSIFFPRISIKFLSESHFDVRDGCFVAFDKIAVITVDKPKLITEFDGGDAVRGKKLAVRHCGACHGPDHISFAFKPNHKKKLLVARKVRGYDKKLKFKPQGGTMSYYTIDRLSDQDLRDIIAYCGK